MWALLVSAIPFIEGAMPSPSELLIAGLFSLAVIATGFLSIRQFRDIPRRNHTDRLTLFAWSLLTGLAIGATNLGVNSLLAWIDPALYDLLAARYLGDWISTMAAAVVEEVVFRLFLLGVIAWTAARFMKSNHSALLTGILLSGILFSLAHFAGRPVIAGSAWMAAVYGSFIVLISGIAGVAFGFMVGRWGLPYCIYSHFSANAFVLIAAPLLLS